MSIVLNFTKQEHAILREKVIFASIARFGGYMFSEVVDFKYWIFDILIIDSCVSKYGQFQIIS